MPPAGCVSETYPLEIVVTPFQGLAGVILMTQGDTSRLAPLRFALGWCVAAPSGRIVSLKWSPSGTMP